MSMINLEYLDLNYGNDAHSTSLRHNSSGTVHRRRWIRSGYRSISSVDGPTSSVSGPPSYSYSTNETGLRATTPGTSPPSNDDGFSQFAASSPSVRYGLDPPRPPRDGFEWVWFPDGYWAERERTEHRSSKEYPDKTIRWRKWSHKKRGSGDRSKDNSSSDMSPKSPAELPRAPLPSPYLSEQAHVLSLQRRPTTFWRAESDDAAKTLREQAFQNQARNFQGSSKAVPSGSSATSIRPALAKAWGDSHERYKGTKKRQFELPWMHSKTKISSFSQVWHKNRPVFPENPVLHQPGSLLALEYPHRLDSNDSRKSSNGATYGRHPSVQRAATGHSKRVRSRELFGFAPWHRKTSDVSQLSVSSSIREVLRGGTPANTPTEGTTKIVPLWSTAYPGGEAQRVKTPPLRENTQDKQLRSFFMDIAQHSVSRSNSKDRKAGTGIYNKAQRTTAASSNRKTLTGCMKSINPPEQMRHGPKEWWEVEQSRLRSEWDIHSRACAFEFDMPEHLPSSPMCPANKKHKSGGTGVCVYHGRRKRSVELDGKQAPGTG